MPQLPSGIVTLSTVVLHVDVGARPYHVEEFQAQLEASGVLKGVLSVAFYQLNSI